jgi:hypothetical protein
MPAMLGLLRRSLFWGSMLLCIVCAVVWIRSYVVTDYVITAAGGGRYCYVLCYWGQMGVIVADPWPGVSARRWVVVHGDDSEAIPEPGLKTPRHTPWPAGESWTRPHWTGGDAVTASSPGGEPLWPPQRPTPPMKIDRATATIMGLVPAPPAVASSSVHFGSMVLPLWLPVLACATLPLGRGLRSALRHDVARYRRRRANGISVESE